MRYTLSEQQCRNLEVSSKREWLLTNGIGGYAMGTAAGINTRRYHGLLVAATTPPTGRMLLLASVDTTVQADGNPVGLSANQYPGAVFPEGYHYLREFSVGSVAVWRYKAAEMELEKRVRIHPGVNAVTIEYRNVGAIPLLLTLRPLICHRDYHSNFSDHASYPEELTFPKDGTVAREGNVSLFISHPKAQRLPVQGWYYRFEHARESDRGLNPRDDLYCPCELRYELLPGESAVLVASSQGGVKPISTDEDEPSTEFRLSPLLKEAAAKFFVKTKTRSSIIAGYPWFTDWGRDTMISIPGLCLQTGRIAEARQILTDYASQRHQGLIPNRFVESGETPDYNTVDATLWFANAVYKTLEAEWEPKFAKAMRVALEDIFDWHVKGTLFGIAVDPIDGLLTQGEAGVQLTWMDAKVGDWVVTPRHGKPVEINGLWINALRVMEWLAERTKGRYDKAVFTAAAEKAESNFESKFWHEHLGHYLDTVDPADASLRPNQVIAMALPFSPVDPEHARRALVVVARDLLTTNGLRTLGPNEPGYRGRYKGPLPDLDASYHQGTAWPWLLGPYVTAISKYTGDRQEAKRILREAKSMITEYGLGGIAEVYDGDEPQEAGGCPWQAWSVAEILRAWSEDVGGD